MKFHGIQLQEGSVVTNMTVAIGSAFPLNPSTGELFFRSDEDPNIRGMYIYGGQGWDRVGTTEVLTSPTGVELPVDAKAGDIFYLNTDSYSEGLYVFNGEMWVKANGTPDNTAQLSGDVSGTVTLGAQSQVALASIIVAAADQGSASKTVTLSVDTKGRVTSIGEQDISVTASQVSSGTFADARISQSSITQHQGSLLLSASQINSGTFANARVSQSNVTQHQSALSIAESQIIDGAILARVGSNETITGNWSFASPVLGQDPTANGHLATKAYVDSVAAGLDPKGSVKAATTQNITLSGSQPIDGIAISAGMRVLVKDQTNAAENGIYVADSGAWVRASDADTSSKVTPGIFFVVEEGDTNADTAWVLVSDGVINLGTTALSFSKLFSTAGIQAGNGLEKSGNTISLSTLADDGTGSLLKFTRDSYGRVSGTSVVTDTDIANLVDDRFVNVTGDTMSGDLAVMGTVGIGTTNPTAILHTKTAGGEGLRIQGTASSAIIRFTDAADASTGFIGQNTTFDIFNQANTAMRFGTNNSERMRIDNSGRLLIGGTSAVNQSSTASADIQISSASLGSISLNNYVASTSATALYFNKSRSGTVGTLGASVASGDSLGALLFEADVGGSALKRTAGIQAWVDGTPSATNAPSRIVFSTATAADSNMVERMRIDSSGTVHIGGSASVDSAKFMVAGTVRLGTNAYNGESSGMFTPTGTFNALNIRNMAAGETYSRYYGLIVVNTAYGSSLTANNPNPPTSILLGGWSSGTSRAGGIEYEPGTGSLHLMTGGTMVGLENANRRLTVDASGNLGIGTTSPNNIIHAASGVGGIATQLKLQNTLTSATAGRGSAISFSGTGDTTFARIVAATSSASDSSGLLAFGTNSGTGMSERMRIDASGNVGIGTSAPSSKLEVSAGANSNGALKVSATGTAAGNFASMNFVTGTAPWTVGTEASTGRFFIYNNAGTTDQLNLSGGTNSNAGLSALGTGVVVFNTAGAERMRVDASGNIAIGTSLASARLQIQGTGSQDLGFFQQGGATNALIAVNHQDAPGTNASARPVVSLRKGGTTMFNLSCDGGSSAQGLTYFESFGTASGQIFITNGSERMRLDASGNLGLGTSTPGVRLDVQGGAGVEAQVLSSGSVARVRVKDSAGNASISTTSGALLLETGSSERARFDNAGALLIGQTVKTSSERVLISYSSAGAVPRTLQLHNPNTTAGTGSLLAFSGLTNSGAQSDLVQLIGLAENATGNGALAFRIAGAAGAAAEAMRLNSSGFLGLGTDAPGYRLDVDHGAGVARFRNGTTGYGSIALGASATAANNCQLASDGSGNFIIYKGVPGSGTEQLRLTSQGNLGVGAVPSSWSGIIKAIDLNAGGSIAASGSGIEIYSNSFYDTAGNFTYKSTGPSTRYQQQAGNHIWYMAPSGNAGTTASFTEVMRVHSSGNVGIGTSAPEAKFHVQGQSILTGTFSDKAWFGGKTTGAYIRGVGDAANGYLILSSGTGGSTNTYIGFMTGSSETERMRIDNSGNTLIGRSTQSSGGKLEVAGNIVANLPSTAPTLGTNSDMSFQLVSNTELKILVRGSDGVTRSAIITLA